MANRKDPKLKGSDHRRISKYKKLFEKGYTPNCIEKVIVIKVFKEAASLTNNMRNLNKYETNGTIF